MKRVLLLMFLLLPASQAMACHQYGDMSDCTEWQRQDIINGAYDEGTAHAKQQAASEAHNQYDTAQQEIESLKTELAATKLQLKATDAMLGDTLNMMKEKCK